MAAPSSSEAAVSGESAEGAERRDAAPLGTGSMLVSASGHTPEVIDTEPGVMCTASGLCFHSPYGRTSNSSCSELVRARWPSWSDSAAGVPVCFNRCRSFADP